MCQHKKNKDMLFSRFAQNTNKFSMKHILEAMGAWLFGFVLPVLTYCHIVYFAAFTDFIVGLYAAFSLMERFSWRKATLIIFKFAAYTSLLAMLYQGQNTLKVPTIEIQNMTFSMVTIACAVIFIAEIKSIDRNWAKIFGYGFWTYFYTLIPFLQKFSKDDENAKNTDRLD